MAIFPITPSCPDFASLEAPVFIIGAAHTGKSELAINTLDHTKPATVIGTAEIDNSEISNRVHHLKSIRPSIWLSLDRCESVIETLKIQMKTSHQILIDSINQWIGGTILKKLQRHSTSQIESLIAFDCQELCQLLSQSHSRICLVSSEVGAGLSPLKPIPRMFRMSVSRINTKIAAICPTVILVSAGVPLILKGFPGSDKHHHAKYSPYHQPTTK